MTAGSASGMAATAREMAVSSISKGGSPRSMPAPNTKAHMASTARDSLRPKRASLFCSGVLTSSSSWSIEAIVPSSVCMPVATTTPAPRP